MGREVTLRSGNGGGDRRIWCKGRCPPPLPAASGKHNSAATTPPTTTTSYATMHWLMRWSKGEIRTAHLPCHCLLRLAQLLPQVLPERLLVLVSCVHVPMPLPHADGLPHDAVRTRFLFLILLPLLCLNLARRTTARCSTKTTDRCLPYSLPTDTVMVRGDTRPGSPSSINSTIASIILLAMSSARCLIGLHLSLSSFALVVVIPHCCHRRRRCCSCHHSRADGRHLHALWAGSGGTA